MRCASHPGRQPTRRKDRARLQFGLVTARITGEVFAWVSSTQTVCQGLNSAVATTTLAPDPALCPEGGVRLTAGTDANGNGMVDDAEISTTQTVYHGLESLLTTTRSRPTPLAASPAG